MTDTLAQIIVKLQELLLDDGTRFTTDTCTAAIRQALKEFNLIAPIHAGTLVTPVTGQKEYELDVENALAIVDVLRQGKDVYTEEHVSLSLHLTRFPRLACTSLSEARPPLPSHSVPPPIANGHSSPSP